MRMRIDKPGQQRMVWPDHMLARLEARLQIFRRPDSENPPIPDRDGMMGQHGIDGRDRQHPAGFDQQVCGLLFRHERKVRLQ
jgi:hypothetical protein